MRRYPINKIFVIIITFLFCWQQVAYGMFLLEPPENYFNSSISFYPSAETDSPPPYLEGAKLNLATDISDIPMEIPEGRSAVDYIIDSAGSTADFLEDKGYSYMVVELGNYYKVVKLNERKAIDLPPGISMSFNDLDKLDWSNAIGWNPGGLEEYYQGNQDVLHIIGVDNTEINIGRTYFWEEEGSNILIRENVESDNVSRVDLYKYTDRKFNERLIFMTGRIEDLEQTVILTYKKNQEGEFIASSYIKPEGASEVNFYSEDFMYQGFDDVMIKAGYQPKYTLKPTEEIVLEEESAEDEFSVIVGDKFKVNFGEVSKTEYSVKCDDVGEAVFSIDETPDTKMKILRFEVGEGHEGKPFQFNIKKYEESGIVKDVIASLTYGFKIGGGKFKLNFNIDLEDLMGSDFDLDGFSDENFLEIKNRIVDRINSGGLRIGNVELSTNLRLNNIEQDQLRMLYIKFGLDESISFSLADPQTVLDLLEGFKNKISQGDDVLSDDMQNPINIDGRDLYREKVRIVDSFGNGESEVTVRDETGAEVELREPTQTFNLENGEKATVTIRKTFEITGIDADGEIKKEPIVVRTTKFTDSEGKLIKIRNDFFQGDESVPSRSLNDLKVSEDVSEVSIERFDEILTEENPSGYQFWQSADVKEVEDALVFTYYRVVDESREIIRTIKEEELGDGLVMETTKGMYGDIRSKKIYQQMQGESGQTVVERELVRALYYDTENKNYILYQDDNFYISDWELKIEDGNADVTRLKELEVGVPEDTLDWYELQDEGNIEKLLAGESFRDVLTEIINSTAEKYSYRYHQYVVKVNKLTDEENVISGVIFNREPASLVGYFIYNKNENTLQIWEPNGEFKYEFDVKTGGREKITSIDKNNIKKYRIRYGDIYLYTPDEEKIDEFRRGVMEEERVESSREYYISQLRRRGVMEGINQRWSDLVGKHAFWFPTFHDNPLSYRAKELVNVAIDGDIRGDGSLGIGWIPINKPGGDVKDVQNYQEYYEAISNASPGDEIRIQHDFDVTWSIVAVSALTALCIANDALLLFRPGWFTMAGIAGQTRKLNLLAKIFSGISNVLSRIPGWRAVSSGTQLLRAGAATLSQKHIMLDMLFRAIYPTVAFSDWAVNTARLVTFGVGLQFLGMTFGGQLGQLSQMSLEDAWDLICSGASFSGVYSYGFGVFMPVIAAGLRAVHLNALIKYLEMITPQRGGIATQSPVDYRNFVLAFLIEEWLLEEVIYPFLLEYGLKGAEEFLSIFEEGDVAAANILNDLELFKDFITETISESIGAG